MTASGSSYQYYRIPSWTSSTTVSEYDVLTLGTPTAWTTASDLTYPSYDQIRGYIPEYIFVSPQRETERRVAQIKEDEERLILRKEANRKARILLLNSLDPVNKWRVLKGERELEVESQIFAGVSYKIPFVGRVLACRNDKVISELCISVNTLEDIPNYDVILAKYLHVLNDERNILQVAKHYNQIENLKNA